MCIYIYIYIWCSLLFFTTIQKQKWFHCPCQGDSPVSQNDVRSVTHKARRNKKRTCWDSKKGISTDWKIGKSWKMQVFLQQIQIFIQRIRKSIAKCYWNPRMVTQSKQWIGSDVSPMSRWGQTFLLVRWAVLGWIIHILSLEKMARQKSWDDLRSSFTIQIMRTRRSSMPSAQQILTPFNFENLRRPYRETWLSRE